MWTKAEQKIVSVNGLFFENDSDPTERISKEN